jgi:hypothetical protein
VKRRELRDLVGQATPGLMLYTKHLCQVDEPAGLLEAREEEVLLETDGSYLFNRMRARGDDRTARGGWIVYLSRSWATLDPGRISSVPR